MTGAKQGVRRALLFSFAQRYTGFLFEFATVVIVSRVLTPAQIGVFSVALGLTVLAQMLRTLGVAEYLVQEKTLDEATVRTAFTITLLIAWALAGALFATSGFVGRFYDDPGVGHVMQVLSGTFVLTPFGTTAMALLKRDLEFGAVYNINTASALARSGCTIGLVLTGFGYMSMAWASLGGMLILVGGCAIWAPHYRVRGLSLSEWKRVLPFGANRTAADVIIQIGEQSANVVTGKMLGMAAAGFYSRGYSIVNNYQEKVLNAIGAVAFPAFAREHRERDGAPDLYLRSLIYITGISWPFFGFAALMAYPIIRLLFGPQWDASVPLMRWLCLAGIFGALTYQCNLFFTAVGRVGLVTSIETRYQAVRLLVVVAAAMYSLEAVAISQVGVYALATALYYRKLTRYEALGIRKLLAALMPSAVTALATCVGPFAVLILWPGAMSRQLIAASVVGTGTAGIGWIAGVYFTKHPLLLEIKRTAAVARDRVLRIPKFE